MAKKEIKTSIEINATPERVWQVLSDFDKYPEWNPFLLSAEGEFDVGNTVKINAGGMKFKPTVLVNTENKELRWIGKLFVSGLFDGEHSFVLEDNKDGTTRLRHEEVFTGILVGLFAKKLDIDTKQGFEQMNRKLKEVAEIQ